MKLDSSELYVRNYNDPDDTKKSKMMLLKLLAKELRHYDKETVEITKK